MIMRSQANQQYEVHVRYRQHHRDLLLPPRGPEAPAAKTHNNNNDRINTINTHNNNNNNNNNE